MNDPIILVLGNRTYSSWSLRGWLLMKLSQAPFDVEMHWLDQPGYKEALLAATGGSGTVPTLRIDERVIPDSLAIAEFAAEIGPAGALWPEDRLDRAEARSLAARMHSGFAALRSACPMNLSNRFDGFAVSDAVAADLRLLEAMWEPCLARSGGPFLFGAFGAADAFFAPVATRIDTFRLPVSPAARGYADRVLAHPLMREWIRDAALEPAVDRPRNDRLSAGAFEPGDWPLLRED